MSRVAVRFADAPRPLKRRNARLNSMLSVARLVATTGLAAFLISLGWILATGDEAALRRFIDMV